MAVAAPAPDFLVEAVDRGRDAGMEHRADVALVHAQPEGAGPDDDVDGRRPVVAGPRAQDVESLVGADVAVEDRRPAKPRLPESVGDRLGRLLLRRVDDGRPRKVVQRFHDSVESLDSLETGGANR